MAKIKVGLYEAVRDGMVVNLLLEAIPDLHLRRTPTAPDTAQGAAVCEVRQPGVPQPHRVSRRAVQNARRLSRLRPGNRHRHRRDESLREADFAFAAEPGVRPW